MSSNYAHVDNVLRKFETEVERHPVIETLPERPDHYPRMDVAILADLAAAIRELPVVEPTKAPQFFSPILAQDLENIQSRYVNAMLAYAAKTKTPLVYVHSVFKSVFRNMDIDLLLNKAKVNQNGSSVMVNNHNNIDDNTTANRSKFNFNKNAEGAILHQQSLGANSASAVSSLNHGG